MQINKKSLNKIKMAILPAAMVLSIGAHAATQGNLSEDNTSGTMFVTADVAPVISISGIDDISLGTITPGLGDNASGVHTREESFCVYSNADNFTLSFESERGYSATSFGMSGASTGDTLPYTVDLEFADTQMNLNDFGFYDIADNITGSVSYGPFLYEKTYFYDTMCTSETGTEDNVRITIKIDDLEAAFSSPDEYTDVLTITARVSAPIPS